MPRLSKLPVEIADEMKFMAWNASWFAANKRFGFTGDATHDEIAFNNHARSIQRNAGALGLGQGTMDHIKWMCWDAAWHAANTRGGLVNDARGDLARFEQHSQAVRSSGEVSGELSDNLRWMAWNAAWHAANKRKGNHEDAKGDLARFEQHASELRGNVILRSVRFNINDAQMSAVKPKALVRQTLVNSTGIDQSQSVTMVYSKGETRSWSHTVGFSFSVSTSFKVGFAFLAESSIDVGFEVSSEHAWGGSTENRQEEQITFDAKVPPNSTLVVTGSVQSAEMDVPYEMLYEVGGVILTIRGVWKGMAFSDIRTTFDEPSPLSS